MPIEQKQRNLQQTKLKIENKMKKRKRINFKKIWKPYYANKNHYRIDFKDLVLG